MSNVAELLGANAEYLLRHICTTIPGKPCTYPARISWTVFCSVRP